MTTFSVIIPTYNRRELLHQAIESVLLQTFDDFELIVVDDASTDGTRDLVSSLDDPRIRYVLNDRNRGAAGARNTGIFGASGVWVAFLDDDDVWLPDKLAKQHARIQEVETAVGLIYTGYAIYDFRRERVLSKMMPEKSGRLAQALLYQNVITGLSTVVVRRTLLRETGGFDERFPARQDVELYVRLAQMAKIDYVPEILVYIRRGHPGRISVNWHNKLLGYQLFRDKYWALIAAEPGTRHRIDSQIFVYALLSRDFPALAEFSCCTLVRCAMDARNYLWLCRELVSQWLSARRSQ